MPGMFPPEMEKAVADLMDATRKSNPRYAAKIRKRSFMQQAAIAMIQPGTLPSKPLLDLYADAAEHLYNEIEKLL